MVGRPKFSMGGRFVKTFSPSSWISDSIVKSALTILGGSVTWDRRLLESGPAPTCLLSTPPWVHQVNVSARVVHLKYIPEKSLPRLS